MQIRSFPSFLFSHNECDRIRISRKIFKILEYWKGNKMSKILSVVDDSESSAKDLYYYFAFERSKSIFSREILKILEC